MWGEKMRRGLLELNAGDSWLASYICVVGTVAGESWFCGEKRV